MSTSNGKYHALEEGNESKPRVNKAWYVILGAVLCCGIIAAAIVIGVDESKGSSGSKSHHTHTPAPTFVPGTATVDVDRKIKTLGHGNSFELDIFPGCHKKDKYGCASFTIGFGETLTLNASVTLARNLDLGSTIKATAEIGPLPLSVECPACGGNCTISIPMSDSRTIQMPDCPIPAISLPLTGMQVEIPADDPIPSGLGNLAGKLSLELKNADGSTELSAEIDLALGTA